MQLLTETQEGSGAEHSYTWMMSTVQGTIPSSINPIFISHSERITTRTECNCSLLWSKSLLVQKSLTNTAVVQYVIPLNLHQSRSLYIWPSWYNKNYLVTDHYMDQLLALVAGQCWKDYSLLKQLVLYCYTFYIVWLGKFYGYVPYLCGWSQPLSHLCFVPCYPHSNLVPRDGNTEAAVILITLMETGFAPGGKDATFYLNITLFFPVFHQV